MMYVILILLFLFAVMTILFFVGVHKINDQMERAERAQEEADTAKAELQRMQELRKEETAKHEEEKENIQRLNTGDSDTDFNNGVSILHQYAGRNKD